MSVKKVKKVKKAREQKRGKIRMRVQEITDFDLFWQDLSDWTPDETMYQKLPQWLEWFRINRETIGFDRSIADLPKVKGSALVVDNPMTGSLEQSLEAMKKYRGCVLATDRALWKVLPYRVPEYTANIDSSPLCVSFYDRPDVREYMDRVTCIFSTTAHPLTVRAWHGDKVWCTPWVGDITPTLCAKSKTPMVSTGGNVLTFLDIVAMNLGANPIGLAGEDNCFFDLSETEYPGVPHRKLWRNPFTSERMKRPVYLDPVYKHYAKIHLKYIKHAWDKHKIAHLNCNPEGIMDGPGIERITMQNFSEKYQ